MQRAELEEARQREANETALLAIGPRKKLKISHNPTNSVGNLSFNSSSNSVPLSLLSFSNPGNKQVGFSFLHSLYILCYSSSSYSLLT